MEYFTKQLFESLQFYDEYPRYESLREYVCSELLSNDKIPRDFNIGLEYLSERHKNNVDEKFNDGVLFAKELKNIIFDDQHNILPLDEYIYFKIRLYSTKYLLQSYEAEDQDYENRKIIESGNYSNEIKELSKSYQHDDNVKLFIKEPYTVILNEYITNKYTYLFHTTSEFIFESSDCIEFILIDKETIPNDDGTFYYNIMGFKSINDIEIGLDEISIQFTHVEKINV